MKRKKQKYIDFISNDTDWVELGKRVEKEGLKLKEQGELIRKQLEERVNALENFTKITGMPPP